MFGSVFKNTTKNEEYRFNELFSDYENRFSSTQRQYEPQSFPDYPRPVIPLNSERTISGVGYYTYYDTALPKYLSLLGYTDFISFVEQYYEWMYTLDPCETDFGANYYITPDDVYRLIDFEKVGYEFYFPDYTDPTGNITNRNLRKRIMKSFIGQYATGLENNFMLSYDPSESGCIGGGPDVRWLVFVLKEIREKFYVRKSSKEGIQWLLSTVYGGWSPTPEVEIYEPKRDVYRLDGGVPLAYNLPNRNFEDGIYFHGTGVASAQVLPDNCWYHDYSYLLRIRSGGDLEVPEDETYNIIKEMIHPAGLQLIFNKENDDYIPPDDFEGEFGLTETTLIGHYNPYRVTETSGLTYGTGCTYDLDGDGSADAFPTHNHPGWATDIPEGTAFNDIEIGDFFFLSPAAQSPNINIPACPES